MRLRPLVCLLFIAAAISGCSVIAAINPFQKQTLPAPTQQNNPALATASDQTSAPPSQDLPRSLPENAPTPRLPQPGTGSTSAPNETPTPAFTPTPVPEQSSDLLYISNERLMRWDHVTQFSSLLVENVTAFVVSPSTRQVALLRPCEISSNGAEVFDLDLLDLATKRVVNILEETPRLYEMSFTNLGEQLIFIQRTDGDRIFALNLTDAGEPRLIAACHKEGNLTCDTVIGSPDGRSIAWRDAQGVWMVDDRDPEPRLVQPNQVVVSDPKGQKTQNPVIFDQLAWSPDSRFILLKIIPSVSGVQWYGLLDTRKARLADIPKSGDFSDQSARLFWTNEGGLLLAHSNDTGVDQPPFIQTWRIVPTANNILSPDKFLYLGADAAQISSLFPPGVSLYPDWLYQFDPISFGMGIINADGASPAHLYRLDMQKNILVEIVQIPADTQQVLWAPDGSGALVLAKSGLVYFVSMPVNNLLDLGATLGETARDFTWLAPVPRN